MKKNKLHNSVAKLCALAVTTSIALCACDNEPSALSQSSAHIQPAADRSSAQRVPDYWPRLQTIIKPDGEIEKRVQDLLATMTLEQKVAQMIQPEIGSITPADMRQYGFGSYLNGGGSFPNRNKHATADDWISLAEQMYQASIDDSLDGSTIPTMWGTDAVHGHNNVIGATLFPHNIGLGAANNPELIEKIAQATAKEVMVTGIDWIFAPTVAVARDDRWGRTYESYSEDPAIVKAYSVAIVKGLQGQGEGFLGDDKVIATVKHFLGDGGTEKGDDQGDNLASEADLFHIHAQGYVGGLSAGAQTVMASFNSWHGKKNHGNPYLLTAILKERMGFDGLVVGDWNGHGQVKGCQNDSCPQSINAGLDIFMAPTETWKPLYHNTIAQVQAGQIPMARIDDAVSRILRVKLRAGLFEKPGPARRPLSGKTALIGAAEHRAIARQAVRESLVLLKNKNGILPLSQQQKILVAGDGADNIGQQSGGWSITWQGTGNQNADFPGATSILQGIQDKLAADGSDLSDLEYHPDGQYQQKPDVAIVVFGEAPYAEGNGDIDNLEFQRNNKKDLNLLKRLKANGIPVVSVFLSGRPMWVNPELNQSDAFVAAWLPGTEGAGIADLLFRRADGQIDFDFSGKLSYSWPDSPLQTRLNHGDEHYAPLLPFGFGLTYQDENRLGDDLTETFNAAANQLTEANLFNAPWRPAFKSGDGVKVISSRFFDDSSITYTTFDKATQEDARRVTFKNQGGNHFEIQEAFSLDLRGYLAANASLSFAIKTEGADGSPLFLSMRCESDCNPAINLSELLKDAAPNSWQNIEIDLSCFSHRGAQMDKIIAPFVLTTDARMTVEFTQLKLTAARSPGSMSCASETVINHKS